MASARGSSCGLFRGVIESSFSVQDLQAVQGKLAARRSAQAVGFLGEASEFLGLNLSTPRVGRLL
jgi:hypothetical protein